MKLLVMHNILYANLFSSYATYETTFKGGLNEGRALISVQGTIMSHFNMINSGEPPLFSDQMLPILLG